MTDRNFPSYDETNAPVGARAHLAATKQAFGELPEPLTRYASSPMMLDAAVTGLARLEETTLSALEREVLAMTMGHANGCQFCLGLHRGLLAGMKVDPNVIAALLDGTSVPVPRLEALRLFILSVLETRGAVTDEAWRAFREAGFSHAHALEVITGISVYTLTTYANRLTETSEVCAM